MNTLPCSLTHLSDQQLLTEVKRLADDERQATARLIASLVELDVRKLYLGEGCSSLFTYCTQILRLTEHAAYGRIEAARAARRFPLILDRLADGSVSLTAVGLLSPHLTSDNHRELLQVALHKSKREVEHIVARLAPRPDVPASVRKLPAPKAHDAPQPQLTEAPASVDAVALRAPDVPPPPRPAVIAPLASERYQLTMTVGRETYEKLCRAKDLLRHILPDGDPAAILDRALTLLVADLEKAKHAATTRPRAPRPTAPGSRHIPAEVKREVWARDGGQCGFIGSNGRRCTETGGLEYHHVIPFAAGGATVVENLRLHCRCHNAYEAEHYFGPGQPWLLREERAPWNVTSSVRTQFRLWHGIRASVPLVPRPRMGANGLRLSHRSGVDGGEQHRCMSDAPLGKGLLNILIERCRKQFTPGLPERLGPVDPSWGAVCRNALAFEYASLERR